MNEYFTVKKQVRTETIIERSRFITSVKRVDSEEEAKAFLDGVKKIYPDATHNCYAYITERGAYSRYSDDGEPAATAGPPIFDVIRNNSLVDTAIVVTRYFGGIKLGTGGLARAYGGCAASGIREAGIVKICSAVFFSVKLNYTDGGVFRKLYSDDLKVVSTDYADGVIIRCCVKKSAYNAFKRDFRDLYSGRYEISEECEDFAEFL